MNKREVGAAYEEAAAVFLEKNGVRILERNFRCRQGEIDLIGRDGEYLVFFEVKYRKNADAGFPAEAGASIPCLRLQFRTAREDRAVLSVFRQNRVFLLRSVGKIPKISYI